MIRDITEPILLSLLRSDPLVLVKIGAPWCGACKQLEPHLSRFASQHPNVAVVSLNADHAQWTVKSYGIQALPTLLVFRMGEPTNQAVAGGFTARDIEALFSVR
jgi:thioredoxin 1